MAKARIIATGSYLPERVLTNKDFEKMVETSDEWIVSRTGIRERRIAGKEEFTSDMAVRAAERAIAASNISAGEIDLILVATSTSDYVFPSTAALVQTKLGLKAVAAFDLQAACTGYLYGLSAAKGFVESGLYKNILLIASEKLSSIVNYEDRKTCVLFGDGAAAAIVTGKGAGLAVENVCLGADGKEGGLLILPGGGSRHPTSEQSLKEGLHYIAMEGQEVFKHAVRRMESAVIECLKEGKLEKDQINWFVPHQANERIIDAMAKRFQLPENKVFKTVHKYGNTSASGIAIALDELLQEHEVKRNENLLLVAFGAGFTWGASILKKVEE